MKQTRQVKFLDLSKLHQDLQPELGDTINEVIHSSKYIGGEYVEKFEHDFANYVGARYCIGVANGTDALEIIIRSLDLSGKEIIVPVNTAVPTVEAVVNSGNTPVFCDCGPDYTLSMDDLSRKITLDTAAVIPVHLYGYPCDDILVDIADIEHIEIIEDCCQAHGARWGDEHVGLAGVASAFSFYPAKNLGALGDGGAIITNNESIATTCRMIADHGRLTKFDHEIIGRNSRLDALQAAVLSLKLPHLDKWVEHRRKMAQVYDRELASLPGLVYTPPSEIFRRHSYHLYVIYAKYRDNLRDYLAARGIETGLHYPFLVADLPPYAQYSTRPTLMLASSFPSHVLSLPMGPHLTEEDVLYVCGAIKDFYS